MKTQHFKANPWFRLYSEFATDHKIQMLNEADQRRFVMLLCLRCSNGDVTLQDAEIAFQLRINLEEWETTKKRFIEAKMIDRNSRVLNWEKRQYLSDSSTERVRRHRERMKQSCNVSVTASNGHETVAVTPPDTETDTDTDTEYKYDSTSNKLDTGSTDVDVKPLRRRKTDQIPFDDIAHVYNDVCGPIGRPAVVRITDKRKKAISKIWRESEKARCLDWWRDYFQLAMSVTWMRDGFVKPDGSTWTGADFDYLLQDKTLTKLIEGNV